MAKTQKQQENTFVTIIAKAIITATSNKVSDDFKQDNPTKTIYFTVQDEKKIKQLEELGMTMYTPEGAPNFFICKATKFVKIYKNRDDYFEKDFGVTTIKEDGTEIKNPNLKTDEPIYLSIVKVKAPKGKNDFFRVNAILTDDTSKLIEVTQENPFKDLFINDEELPF
jgi:hypothetical protein